MAPGPTLVPLTDRVTRAGEGPVLVLGAGLGTTAKHLWGEVVRLLPPTWTVLGLDLPGHGHEPAATAAYTLDDLAQVVVERVGDLRGPLAYAGVSMAGALALHLALREDCPFDRLAVVCGTPRFGTPQAWHDRADLVRREGLAPLEAGSRERWFAPGFAAAHPDRADALVGDLLATDPQSYAYACEALAAHDVTDRLGEVRRPVTWVGGADDTVCPPDQLRDAARRSGSPAPEILPGVAHQAPVEDPVAVADSVAAALDR